NTGRDIDEGLVEIEYGGDEIGPGGMTEDRKDIHYVFLGRCLVQADADVAVGVMEVQSARFRVMTDSFGIAYLDPYRIEEIFIGVGIAQRRELGSQRACQQAHSFGDTCQAFGTVIDRVHGGHIGKQRLRGADVGGGFFAFDMLFACLEGHAKRAVAICVDADADDATGDRTFKLFACREERRVRTAETHWNAKTLRVPDGYVSP